MIDQVIERPETESPETFTRLTAQEVEQLTQPLYERSIAEMKVEWQKRFQDRRRETRNGTE